MNEIQTGVFKAWIDLELVRREIDELEELAWEAMYEEQVTDCPWLFDARPTHAIDCDMDEDCMCGAQS